MLRAMRHLAAALVACCLAAGEASPPPVISITAPDLARSAQRLSAGPYGAIWRLPAVQKLRDEMARTPGADPAWMALAERVQEARAELTLRAEDPQPRLALRLPAGADPQAPEGAQAVRSGDWWLLGEPGDALAVPPPAPGPDSADLRLAIDLPAIAASLEPEAATRYRAVLGVLGLTRIEAEATAGADGVRERLVAPGARLPLRAVDAAALAGFPAKPMGIVATGIDGAALVRTVHAVATAAGGTDGLAVADKALRAQLAIGLDDLLRGFDGTIVLATTPGSPMPGMTLTLPAAPQTDALVQVLLGLLRQDGEKAVAEARSNPVVVPLPNGTPVLLSLRRTATRWIVSTDQALILELGQDAPPAFPVAATWPKADGAVSLAWGDTRAQMQMIAGLLPMALMQVRDDGVRRQVQLAQQALFAALPHLRPSVMVTRQDAAGLRIDGENGLITGIFPVSIGAGMALPAISLARESARRANAGSNMRQICLAMLAYGTDYDGRWPADFAEVKKYADGELVDKLFQSPGHPEIADPFLYVRPDPRAKSNQPVIVQDPACNRGKGSLVVYGDGHVAFVKGVALWAEAQRLAALPKAKIPEQGIEMSDWTVDTETGLPTGVAPPADAKALF